MQRSVDMAARIFSPLQNLWRKSDSEHLLENDVIALQNHEYSLEVEEKCFAGKDANHKMGQSGILRV